MDRVSIVNTGRPHEVREFEYGRLELYRVGSIEIGRAIYEPGWRWTEHVRPTAGTELCEISHVGLVLEGSAAVKMADGYEFTITEGDFFAIPAGHDSWVVGDRQYVSLHLVGAESYAAPATDSERRPDLEGASDFMRLVGLRFEELSPTHVRGFLDTGRQHHQPWGLVHGGVLASVVETAATTGAYVATEHKGLTPVGITNTTHFLRAHREGPLDVEARVLHGGRSGQLWSVEVTARDSKRVATGTVRLQNLDKPPRRAVDRRADR